MQLGASDLKSFVGDYRYVMEPYRKNVALCIASIVLMQIAALAEPYAMKFFLDAILIGTDHTLAYLATVSAVLYAVLNVGNIVGVVKNHFVNTLIYLLDRDVPKRCLEKILALPLSFHERENTGLIVSNVTKGIHKSIEVTASLLFEIVPLAVQTIIAAGIIGYHSVWALAIFVVTVAVFTWATVIVKRRLAPSRERRHRNDQKSYERLGEIAANIRTVQTNGQERRELQEVSELREEIFSFARHELRTHARFDFLRNNIVGTGRVLVMAFVAWLVFRRLEVIGTFVLLTELAGRVFVGCYRMGSTFDRVQEASNPVHRMVEMLDAEVTVQDPPNPVLPQQVEGRVSVRNVTHHYPAKLEPGGITTRPALADVSIEIAPGETIGIVGPSGSGKSTLINLLLRTDDPTFGHILVDGIDLRLMMRSEFRKFIGLVSQEVDIFNRSFSDNIRYGMPGATMEQVIEAAKIADIHDFIMEQPLGYETPLGNHGMRLSGGQRQRVGIARALVKNPAILVLDEATSHIDTISEERIQRSVERARSGRTTIVCAHRLSTIRNADRIIVIDQGRVAETGTHGELLGQKGLYARLVAGQ